MKWFTLIAFTTTAVFTSANGWAHANMECTDKPKSAWLHPLEVQKRIVNEYGFAIKKFQEAGSCYEIYGWALNKEGKKFEEIEVYFNPINGDIVKKKFRD